MSVMTFWAKAFTNPVGNRFEQAAQGFDDDGLAEASAAGHRFQLQIRFRVAGDADGSAMNGVSCRFSGLLFFGMVH